MIDTLGLNEEVLKALASESLKVQCIACGEEEWILPIDEPIDETFIANYHCDNCDEKP